jgi:16S rRNA (uracil1498-N3)-methyltransferase
MKKIHWFTDHTIPHNLKRGDEFEIHEKEVVKQVSRVLKLQKGEHMMIKSDSFGYECEIIEVSHAIIRVLILNKKESVNQKRISLIVCVPKKDKFELILEKCTEIGITDFYPVISDRTIKTNINVERATKIIQEASEQAQRLDTSTLHTISKLDDVLGELKPIVFDVEGEKWGERLCHSRERGNPENIKVFLIGPEGGFSQREVNLFKEKGLKIYKLGETVLKTETAAIVVSGLLLN